MRLKTAILGGAAALLLGTGLTGVALAETPKPPTVTPSASPVPGEAPTKATPVCVTEKKKPAPCPAVPRPAEPSYTG
jgi:hypothetical protein